MLISPHEADLFFKLHSSLMQYANERLNVVPSGTSPGGFRRLAPEDRRKVVTAFLARKDLIDSFVTENPAGLSREEGDIVSSWHHLVAGRFVVLRQLKKHAIFLFADKAPMAYGVLALTEPFEDVIGMRFPAIVETVLFPFRGRIIYDGLVARFHISFGSGDRANFEDSYRAAQERQGLVTSLPAGEPRPAASASIRAGRPTPKSQQPAPDLEAILEEIVNMTTQFCQAHLNQEYAGHCRKLAEKLARKRPSPLLRGQLKTWACAIVRTIGWVNFLDDRSTQPYMKLTDIDKAFGVGESTAQGKAKEIRRLLKIGTFDPNWTLPSHLEDNPMIWTFRVNGLMVDIRKAPVPLQRQACRKGLIPYVPADRDRERAAASANSRIYQFKITLRNIEPPIWRRIQVPDGTIDKLHEHIQAAMGWTNSHLHQFFIHGKCYGDPELLGDGADRWDGVDSTTTMIHDVMPSDGTRLDFKYEYDFGDGWEHEVLFEGSLERLPDAEYPLCLEGERACPPEDVGGAFGYADYLEAMADPKHEQHEEFLQWGGPFNPEAFNPKRATQAMQEGLPDWRNGS